MEPAHRCNASATGVAGVGVRIAIVGGCASGKTSLSNSLRALGFDAWPVAQEHSVIADLWRHLDPDRLVVLEATLESVRRRRNDRAWPRWIWELQQQRIAHARVHADLVIQTDELSPEQVIQRVIALIRPDSRSPAVASPCAGR
jgi:broad-specificity NMP kinase